MGELSWLYECGSVLAAAGIPLAVALFLAGLGGSLTHCATMCSVFVLGQTEAVAGKGVMAQLLVPYHAGRLATYAGLGATAGFGLQFISASPLFFVIRHLLLALVAVILLGVFVERTLRRVGVQLPLMPSFRPKCAVSAMARVRAVRSPLTRFGLGAALGFLPCPMIFAALLASAASADPLAGGLAMAAFAAGTMPVLMGVGVAGIKFLNSSPRVRQALSLAAFGVNGVVLLALAFG